MQNTLSVELQSARKAAGLTQHDVAYLLQISQSNMSALETGRISPSQEQFLKLAIIYGSAFEQFQIEQDRRVRQLLLKRLENLRQDVRITANTYNRPLTLERLRNRLSTESDAYEASA